MTDAVTQLTWPERDQARDHAGATPAAATVPLAVMAQEPVAAVRHALIEAVAMFEAGDGVRALGAAQRALQASERLVVEGPEVVFVRRVQAALDRGALAALEGEARARLAHGGRLDALGAPMLTEVLLARGDFAAARVALTPAAAQRAALPAAVAGARLRIAHGDPRGGASRLLELSRAEAMAPVAWEADAAVALIQARQTESAARVARTALARAGDDPVGRAAALRAFGLATLEPSALAKAAASADTGSATLLQARALHDLGAMLRRQGQRQAARAPLRRAADLARHCGAAALAEAARVELRATGARARRELYTGVDALTPSELRVARLAAERHSYRSIAAELFISVKTVETHLGRVYRKLDIQGRDQLAAALH